MVILVRNHPIKVYYLTGEDARYAREGNGDGDSPCFVTASFGEDGFCWDSAEDFEESYQDAFGPFETLQE